MTIGSTENPRIWLGGKVHEGPVGTTAPDDVETALDGDFNDLGLLSEDGTEEARDDDTSEHYARGGVLVRVTRSKHKRTIKVSCLEDNPIVQSLINPGSTQSTTLGLTTRSIKIPTPNPRAFVITDTDGTYTARKSIARGEVIEVGPEKRGPEMTMRELTIVVYPSADGTLYTEITDEPAAVVV